MLEDLTKFRVAAVQMVSSVDAGKNFSRAEHLLSEAKSKGATIVALPENFLIYGSKKKPDIQNQRQHVERIAGLAKKLNIWLVAGSYPLSPSVLNGASNDVSNLEKPYATSIVVTDTGEIHGHYHKVHLFDAVVGDNVKTYRESDEYGHGDAPKVFESPFGCFGVAICYDLRFPELFSKLVTLGAKMIFLPSAFTEVTGRAHWETLVRARAIETQCYVVAPNQGGQHEVGRSTYGHSMIVNPWGEVLAQAEYGEDVLIADIDISSLDKIRRDMPVQTHRRL